ncbi:4'-phosphopantetheinyl transferase superfamily protein [Affinibrenneria salicis]|uniref:Enterobactin synthase component D n=1 Tax=Affinibrenneria salicis TaxID=2590031 RepID=A0A5J5FXT5_9GAMM|nr:4'-phosphopantetheinyl transferase superfamily protein [Affinibrenneria salicis]KAA8998924.1 4'-phosphopantetheinyl transferase superfamily protein [Affinibrenneria salicis]
MLSAFINEIEWITWPQTGNLIPYPGLGARCRFHPAAWHDSLFNEAGIPCPGDMARAVIKRRAEFLAGRYLARLVLNRLGHPGVILSRAADRSPQWPSDIAGSLSHSAGYVICAAHRRQQDWSGVGLDIEMPVSEEQAATLWPGIVSEEECQWLRTQAITFDAGLTLCFSAKESLFKALYPAVEHYFDFLDARICALDLRRHSFELELLTDLNATFSAGRRFSGIWQRWDDNIMTFIYSQ